MLRAARVGVEIPGDVTIRVRELGGERGGGFDGDGISKAVVDMASPKARSEQVFWRAPEGGTILKQGQSNKKGRVQAPRREPRCCARRAWEWKSRVMSRSMSGNWGEKEGRASMAAASRKRSWMWGAQRCVVNRPNEDKG